MGTYNLIKLKDLEVGTYVLKLNMTPSQRKFITINVCQGSYWEGSFILQKNRLKEYTAPSSTLRVEQVKCTKTEGASDNHDIQIQLDNFSDSSRVHIVA